MTRRILSAAVIAAGLLAQAACATAPSTEQAAVPGRVVSAQSAAREQTSRGLAQTMRQPSCGDNTTRGAVC